MMHCRFDGKPVNTIFCDLGFSPVSNGFLTEAHLNKPETYYPLKVYVSERTFLVQLEEFKQHSEIFDSEYVYFSSFSSSWLKHCERYVEQVCERFQYLETDLIAEVASNDGYLLQYFLKKGHTVLGIEPTANTAKVAQDKGIDTVVDFFGVKLAEQLRAEGKKAKLLIGNNVLAHVPNINDFVSGLKVFLAEDGVITMEFPHLLQLVKHCQFDTIYHEHFSYLSLYTVSIIFKAHGLSIFDVEELPTHGGSLRIYATHANMGFAETNAYKQLLQKEINAGINNLEFYKGFQQRVNTIKNSFLSFLLKAKAAGKKVAAYGAAAKGNTLINYAGVKPDLLPYVVDANPAKQGKYLPGSHIPVYDPKMLLEYQPDYIIVLPWNIKNEIEAQHHYVKDWGCEFVTFFISTLEYE